MTEADLEIILARGAGRLRAERALWAGLAAFGVGVVVASVLIFVLRVFPLGSGVLSAPVQAALALPVLIAAAVLTFVFVRCQPLLEIVALLMDSRAGTAEHLVTWYQLRMAARTPSSYPLPAEESNEVRRAFRDAQASATLALASHFEPRRLLPIRLPEWSRALWLALLLLCCALLMPPRARSSRIPGPMELGGMPGLRDGSGINGGPAADSHTPHVQVLNPSDLLIFQLKATDPLLPPEAKAEVLKELLKKIGNLPESELSPEVRELLNMLRSEVAMKDGGSKPGEQEGRQQGKSNGEANEGTANPLAGAAQVPDFAERAMATVEQNFGDVREPLEKYYKEIRKSKSKIRRKQE